jgi:hypothetical protein
MTVRGQFVRHAVTSQGPGSMAFRNLDVGDVFRLDGRLYKKKSKYSALLLCSAADKQPMINIKRMIHPDITVVCAEIGVA